MKRLRGFLAFFLVICLLFSVGCGKKSAESVNESSKPEPTEETMPKTVETAYRLIEECRFDEAYELLLTLESDKEAEKLLRCYILFPKITIDYPEEKYEDVEITVRGYLDPPASDIVIEGEKELPYFLMNLAPYSSVDDVLVHYDEKGRIKSYATGDSFVKYEYDDSGRLLKTVSKEKSLIYGTSELETTTEYDENGNPTSSYNKYEMVLYTYDGGLLTKKQVQDSYHAYFYEYFYENGRLSYINLNGKLDIKYEYDEEGNILAITNKSDSSESVKVTEETNSEGNILKVYTSSGGLRVKKYDQNGNLVAFDGPTEGYGSLKYDEAGRLILAEWSANYEKQSFVYTYDENGRLSMAVCNREGREITYHFTEYRAYYIPNAEIREALSKVLYFGGKI